MQVHFQIFLAFVGVATSTCNHDNCARALLGAQHRGTIVTSDCSSFLETTLIPPISTRSVTITSVINVTTTSQPAGRQEFATVPAYAADKCLNAAEYASACSCFGVTAGTVTAPMPFTTTTVTAFTTDLATITVPPTSNHSFTYFSNSSSTSSAAPTISINPNCTANTSTDPQNCGVCGNICSSGACENGICTKTQCQGQTCGSFTTCSGNSTCYCFTSASNSGFCAQNALCSGLAPCFDDYDCAGTNNTGDTCAINTCCSAPTVAQPGVCLKAICGNPAANLKMISLALTVVGETAAG